MPTAIALQFTDGTLLAAGASVSSQWMDTATEDHLAVSRTSTGGTYQLDIEWSRDGATADVTETVAVANNTSVVVDVPTPYARVTVRNTDGVAAFTAHRTTVYSR